VNSVRIEVSQLIFHFINLRLCSVPSLSKKNIQIAIYDVTGACHTFNHGMADENFRSISHEVIGVVIEMLSEAVKPPGQDELIVTTLSHGPPIYYFDWCIFQLYIVMLNMRNHTEEYLPEARCMNRRMTLKPDKDNILGGKFAGFSVSIVRHARLFILTFGQSLRHRLNSFTLLHITSQ
jgi:hypothetical protein